MLSAIVKFSWIGGSDEVWVGNCGVGGWVE